MYKFLISLHCFLIKKTLKLPGSFMKKLSLIFRTNPVFLRFYKIFSSLESKRLPGISLIEVTIVLIILGCLTGAILKGQVMIEQARISKTIKNIEDYRGALEGFLNRYGSLPGDFPDATSTFGSQVPSGDGNGTIDGKPLSQGSDAGLVWIHLYHAKFIPAPNVQVSENIAYPKTPFGGGFTLQMNPNPHLPGLWMILGVPKADGQYDGLLTPHQARLILEKLDSTNPQNGDIQAYDGANAEGGSCVREGRLNTENKKRSCVVYVRIDL
jgi:type II secretory pathway pseudopilin PulG